MKVTYGQIHGAFRGCNMLMAGKRNLPTLVKFSIARLHDKLEKDFHTFEEFRHTLVQKHGTQTFADEEKTQSTGWQVPEGTDAYKAFEQDWSAFCEQTTEIVADPIPLGLFGNGNDGVEALEFKLLGPFVQE